MPAASCRQVENSLFFKAFANDIYVLSKLNNVHLFQNLHDNIVTKHL